MNRILLFSVLLILQSCGIQYDGETKLVVKGKIIHNNLPMVNKEVNLYVYNQGSSSLFFIGFPSETNSIGKAKTDSDGNYTMVIPKPENFSEIIVQTNSDDNEYNAKQFKNINLTNFNDYQLNLATTTLFNKTNLTELNVIPNSTSSFLELTSIEYIGILANEVELINPIYNELGENYIELRKTVLKNQTIVLRYTIKDNQTQATNIYEQNVVIDNSNQINFTLNY